MTPRRCPDCGMNILTCPCTLSKRRWKDFFFFMLVVNLPIWILLGIAFLLGPPRWR